MVPVFMLGALVDGTSGLAIGHERKCNKSHAIERHRTISQRTTVGACRLRELYELRLGQDSSCLIDCIDLDKQTNVPKLAWPWWTEYGGHQMDSCVRRERASESRYLNVTEPRPGANHLHDGDLSI
jgi:hypothetical protein